MPAHTVGLEVLGERGVGLVAAYERLGEALGPGALGDIGDDGVVEVTIKDARDFDDALQRVWDAMASAGADDHFVLAEHPDVPEHWRRRGASGGGALS